MSGAQERTLSWSPEESGRWWHEVTATALVGTARRPLDTATAAAAGRALGARWDDGDPALALLDQLALGVVLAAQPPLPVVPSPPPPAGEEVLRLPPRAAAQLLGLLLAQSVAPGHDDQLVAEWCRLAAGAGVRVPPPRLPALLDRAASVASLRVPVAAVLGDAGQALCALNPAWAVVAAAGPSESRALDEDAWSRMTGAERRDGLAAHRAVDPAAARGWLQRAWDGERASVRAELLARLSVGLGPEDADWLEECLDDRSASVREAACGLLDGLPQSARATRIAERLRPLLGTGGRRIRVDEPPDPGPEGRRDGLDPTPPRGTTRREARVRALAAGAPPEVVRDAVAGRGGHRLPVAELVDRIDDDALLWGLCDGATARRDPAWAVPLLARTSDPRLAALVPAPELVSVVDRRLSEASRGTVPPERATALADLLRALPGPWPRPLADRALRTLARPEFPVAVLLELRPHLLDRLPASSEGTLEDLARARPDPRVRGAWTTLRQAVAVRASLHRAFA